VVDEGGTKEKEGERKREIEASEGKTEHPGEPTARYARHGATIPPFLDFLSFLHIYLPFSFSLSLSSFSLLLSISVVLESLFSLFTFAVLFSLFFASLFLLSSAVPLEKRLE